MTATTSKKQTALLAARASAPQRRELLQRFDDHGRALNIAVVGLALARAARFGLQPVDQQCAALLHFNGPMAVGTLARMAGLTASTITAVVDRLEAAGFARRQPDPDDRRKVQVVPLAESDADDMVDQLRQRMETVLGQYTNAEIELLIGYFEQAGEVLTDHLAQLRA